MKVSFSVYIRRAVAKAAKKKRADEPFMLSQVIWDSMGHCCLVIWDFAWLLWRNCRLVCQYSVLCSSPFCASLPPPFASLFILVLYYIGQACIHFHFNCIRTNLYYQLTMAWLVWAFQRGRQICSSCERLEKTTRMSTSCHVSSFLGCDLTDLIMAERIKAS